MESNKLILNQGKTKTMLIGSRQILAKSPNFCIQLHGKVLEKVLKFSYLGIVLDETLSWKDHVENVSSKVSRRLGVLSRIRSCLTLEASKQVILHSCSRYLTTLIWPGVSVRDGAKSFSAYKTELLELFFKKNLNRNIPRTKLVGFSM